ncbi:MinD/ParA family protein [Bacillus solimangrovi]|uniref:Cobyrinic acid a,c-diamide synthase n=1 Tax=Bacillus solimangrovi TaxID=1305675 RepID=A0A1E5LBD0_9BACI|nr:MinD/ParA family protein [Bacillus solimangrovi]OEH91279.1 cobyrinic acid a,c-diamide synthase [Bacillus solimangrovi]
MRDQAESLRIKLKKQQNQSDEAKAIAVVSGKGGVGKSNFSLNFALSLSNNGSKVLLFDMDIGMGNIDILMGVSAKYSILDLFEHNMVIRDIIESGPGNLSYIAGATGMTTIFKMEQASFNKFMEQLQTIFEEYDYIIFDMGAGMTEESMRFILSVQETIVVTTPEPTSLTDAYAMIKYIHNQRDDLPFYVLVNRTFDERQAVKTYNRLQKVAKHFLERDIQFLGSIPDDRSVMKAVANQTPFLLHNERSSASKAIMEIIKRYENHHFNLEDTSKLSFVSKLKRFFIER